MSQVDFIRERLPIGQFVSRYTGGLKRRGRPGFFAGRCPFCLKPTFWVNTLTGYCGCWRSKCQNAAPGGGLPMDVINFYARLHSVGNSQAIADLWQLVSAE